LRILAAVAFRYFEGEAANTMDCQAPRTVHTIGHSTRALEELLTLVRAHGVEMLVDVRRWPASRRYPQFNRAALSDSLKASGLDYLWRGDLGGFRKAAADSVNSAWRVGAFRAYADFMLTAEFERIMSEMETLAGERRIALMCAEAVPWRCHRQLLSDAFLVRGWSVRHIMDEGCHEHKLPPFAHPEGTRIFYRGLL
jgi:uncharacterized protein (DUF488 family)